MLKSTENLPVRRAQWCDSSIFELCGLCEMTHFDI